MSKVLIITLETVGPNIAGPAIRYLEMARYLSCFHEVTLAVPKRMDFLENIDFKVVVGQGSHLRRLVNRVDVVVVQGVALGKYPFLKDISKPLVVDLYAFILEGLESAEITGVKNTLYFSFLQEILEQLNAGDFFLCTHQKIRDFWLGMLCAVHRINPFTYGPDRSFEKLIAVVPFGLPSQFPTHKQNVLKGVCQNIEPTHKVLLWWGGLWDWVDPLSPIQAMSLISKVRDDVKLCFFGAEHPDPMVHQSKTAQKAIALSRRLGLTGKSVFFFDWVPYRERENYLLEADLGLSTHSCHLETKFAYRTRILDYLWAALPIVTTDGDSMAELVEEEQLGTMVKGGDWNLLAEAILELLDNEEFQRRCKENLRNVAPRFRWDEVLRPLNEFCKNPKLAQDKKYLKKLRFQPPLCQPSRRNIEYFITKLKYLRNEYGIKYIIKYCWQFLVNKLTIKI